MPTFSWVVKGILFRERRSAWRPVPILVAEEYVVAADAGAGIIVFALPWETIVRPRLSIRSLAI
jgi:hypothetical protein